jgi:hypothetical protein
VFDSTLEHSSAGIAPGEPGAQKPSAGLHVLLAVREIEQAREKQLGIAADLQPCNPSEKSDELRIGSFDAVFLHAQAVLSAERRSLGISGGCSPSRSRP